MRVAVLASGRGSNLEALCAAQEKGELGKAKIVLVLSDKPMSLALERARFHRIGAIAVEPSAYLDKQEYEEQMLRVLKDYEVECLVLAGYMRLVGKTLLHAYEGRIINIHPSLLPSFPGLEAQTKAVSAGVKVSGCTVHFVDGGLDSGPIIAQTCVPVLDQDTASTLAARILVEEHKLLPLVVRALSLGEIKRQDQLVVWPREERMEI